ncbi:MAG: hypothetical protein ACXAB2_01435 [Candidatus Hodarchaeales archaeon]
MNEQFKCKYCNFIPRSNEIPSTGVWYCPKCGKRTTLERARKIPRKFIHQKKTAKKITRDQASSKIYSKFTFEKKPDFGLKAPYLKPTIKEIQPKIRKHIRVFYQSKSEEN